MALGILLYYLSKLLSDSTEDKNSFFISCILTIVSLFIVVIFSKASSFLPVTVMTIPTIYGLASMSFLLGQSIYQYKVFNNALFAYIGKRSYGIYLLHWLLIHAYDNFVHMGITNPFVDWFIKYITVIIVSLILTQLFSHVTLVKSTKNSMKSAGC